MHSLRNRLIASTFAATLVVLVIAGGILYASIRSTLISEVDATLLAKAQAISSLLEHEHGGIELELKAGKMPEFQSDDGHEFFEIRTSQGAVLVRSETLGDDSLTAGSIARQPNYRFVLLPNDRPGRQVSLPVVVTEPEDRALESEAQGEHSSSVLMIEVARETARLNQSLWRLGWLLVGVAVGATLVSAMILIAVIRFTLQPVEKLAAQIEGLDAENVSSSPHLSCSIDELTPVVERLNELLTRLDQAFTREKAFSSDVAHELRTPLAGLSAAMEVCLTRSRDEAAYREVLNRCLGTTRSMQGMVENLMTLARADASKLVLQKEALDLVLFTRKTWLPFQEKAEQRGIRIEQTQGEGRIVVSSDSVKLRLVLDNLFDNAVRYTDANGLIQIGIHRVETLARITIENTGCDLPLEKIDSVFERFWRHDTARGEAGEHCGLGLPLCRKIVEILGGDITATVQEHHFRIELVLPVSD